MRLFVTALLFAFLAGCASQEQTYTPLSEFPNDAGANASLPELVQEGESEFLLHVLYFYGGTCQYSARATPTVDEMVSKHPNVAIHYYEVWYDAENKALYDAIADVYGIAPDNRGVPIIFIDGEYLLGYQMINAYLGQEINACITARCRNPLDALTDPSVAVPV